jgi:TonB family protein
MRIIVVAFAALVFMTGAPLSPVGLTIEVNQQSASDSETRQLTEAANLNSTVKKLFAEGKFDEALPLAKRVLEIRERVLGADDDRVVAALMNLAEIYNEKRKFGDAQALFERVLAIYEKKVGPNDLNVAIVLDRLGPIYFNRRLDHDAEQSLSRAVSIKEKVLGAEDVAVANSLDSLGQVYRLRGDAKKAEPLFDRALMIMQKALPEDSPAISSLFKHYSCLLYETRQPEKLKGLNHKYVPPKQEQGAGNDYPTGEVLNGKAIRLVQPSYPDEARRARASGVVVVSVSIDEQGKVIEAHDRCGSDPVLAKPSLAAALESQFTPTKLSGQPVKVTGVIVYNFVAH